jgi:hypothetical protein
LRALICASFVRSFNHSAPDPPTPTTQRDDHTMIDEFDSNQEKNTDPSE